MKIREFYETVSDKFPSLNYEQVEAICLSPFKYLKFVFNEGSLDSVRIKHLGVFKVSKARVKRLRKLLDTPSYISTYPKSKVEELTNKLKEYDIRHSESDQVCTKDIECTTDRDS